MSPPSHSPQEAQIPMNILLMKTYLYYRIPTYDQNSIYFSDQALGEGIQLNFASDPQSWSKLDEIANHCMHFYDNQGPNRAFCM